MPSAFDAFCNVQERIANAMADPMPMAEDFFKENIIAEDFRDRENIGILQQRKTLVEAVANDIKRHPNHIKTVIAVMRRYDSTKALAEELEEGIYKLSVCTYSCFLFWTNAAPSECLHGVMPKFKCIYVRYLG